jgi:hypothetical protein
MNKVAIGIIFLFVAILSVYSLAATEKDVPSVERFNVLPFDLIGNYHAKNISVEEGYMTVTIYESNKYIISSRYYDSVGGMFYGHILIENDNYYLLPLKPNSYFEDKTIFYHDRDTILINDKNNRTIVLKKDRMIDKNIIDVSYNLTRKTSKRIYEVSSNLIEIDIDNKFDLEIINGKVIIYSYYNGEFIIGSTYGYLHILTKDDWRMTGEIISDSFNFLNFNDGIVKIEITNDEIIIIVPINEEGESFTRQYTSRYNDEMESPFCLKIIF